MKKVRMVNQESFKMEDWRKEIIRCSDGIKQDARDPSFYLSLWLNYHAVFVDSPENRAWLDERMKLLLSQEKEKVSLEIPFELGCCFAAQTKNNEAVFFFKKCSYLVSKLIFPHYLSGLCYLKNKKFSEALESFKQALSCDPNVLVEYSIEYYLGVCALELADFNSAIKYLTRAREKVPKRILALPGFWVTKSDVESIYYFSLGMVYWRDEKLEKAKENFQKAAESVKDTFKGNKEDRQMFKLNTRLADLIDIETKYYVILKESKSLRNLKKQLSNLFTSYIELLTVHQRKGMLKIFQTMRDKRDLLEVDKLKGEFAKLFLDETTIFHLPFLAKYDSMYRLIAVLNGEKIGKYDIAECREILREYGFENSVNLINAIDNFRTKLEQNLKVYKAVDQIPDEQEKEMLYILKEPFLKEKTGLEEIKSKIDRTQGFEKLSDLEKAELELGYLNGEYIVKINGKVIEEFKTSENDFARFLRLAVAMATNERNYEGRIYKYDDPDNEPKCRGFNLYIGGFCQEGKENKEKQDKQKKRDTELYDLRNFLGNCESLRLGRAEKRRLIWSRKHFGEVRLGVKFKKITIKNIETLENFKSALSRSVKNRFGTPIAEINEALIKDAYNAYIKTPS